jgi:hypothetical protein
MGSYHGHRLRYASSDNDEYLRDELRSLRAV